MENILDCHAQVFCDELGLLKDTKVSLKVIPDAQPHYVQAQPVPYALRSRVDAEIERLQKEGVIAPVKYSDWAAPIVPVVKKDCSIRICGDFKCTLNLSSMRYVPTTKG